MSMFSFPDSLTPESMMKSFQQTAQPGNAVPRAFYPGMAAGVAATAIGVGMAAHMTGLALGMMRAGLDLSAHGTGMPGTSAHRQMLAAWGMPAEAAEEAVVPPAPAARPAPRSAEDAKPAARQKRGGARAGKAASRSVAALKTKADTAAEAVAERAKPAPAGDAAEIQPEDFKRPAEFAKPTAPDDLKRISGIGPKLEEVLNRLGVWTFAQIAEWTPQESAWVDDYLQFSGRIERDDWIRQAAAFDGAKG